MSWSTSLLRYGAVALLLHLLSGCQTFHPKPLDTASVTEALSPPPFQSLRVEAETFKHPILKALELNETDGLTPEEAGLLAVLVNPELRAERDRRLLAQAQVVQAGILPNPQFAYSLDHPIGGVTQGTVDAYSYGLSWDLKQLLPLASRKRAAMEHRRQIDLDIAWKEWQVAEAAKVAAYQFIALNRQILLSTEVDRRLQENLDRIQRAVDKGLMTALDLAAAEAASQQAHNKLLDLRKQAASQRLALNRLLGVPPQTRLPLDEKADLPAHFTPPGQAALLTGLEQRRLDLVALRRGYQSQEASLRAAILEQFPAINLGLNKARDTGDVITHGFSINLDLPIFDRNQGQIGQERATRQVLFDEYVNRLFQARADIADLLTSIRFLNQQIRLAESTEPSLERLRDTYRTAVKLGQADVLSYYTAWNDLTQKRIDIVALKQQLMEARIGLELATGLYHVDGASGMEPASPAAREIRK